MSSPPPDGLPADHVEWIERQCQRFEAALQAWTDGPPPALEDYLGDRRGPTRTVLLRHLVHLELVYRRLRGRPLTPEEFHQRFPDLGHLDSFQPAPGMSPGTTVPTTLPATELTPEPPDSVPPCQEDLEILGELGRGGMGVVYKAWQKKLGRPVALKMLRSAAAEGDRVARFHAEARALARLQHPNIVQVYDVGQVEGRPYFVLEYVPGGSLDRQTCRRPQDPHEAARLVAVLARAVDAAHRAGIVHRDLKPANVLLAPSRPGDVGHTAWGLPKLSDFGLARPADGRPGLTADGVVLGTAGYMAPEQAEGVSSRIGPPADVYGLGAILYELLTGRPPFGADSLSATLTQVLTREPEPPRRLRPEVPMELEAACLRCLAKRPQDRYASASALAQALEDWLANRPPEVGGQPPQTLLRNGPRPRPWRQVAAVGMTLLAGLAALLLSRRYPAEPQAVPAPEWKGSIDLLIWEKDNPRRRGLRLDDPAALPVKPGDLLRLEARVNRPAYLYVLWIDTDGKVSPLYPWRHNDWAQRRPEELLQELNLPEERSEWTKLPPERPGMDILLLLVRPTPLPHEVKANLRERIGTLPRQPLLDLMSAAWFENGRPVELEPDRAPLFDEGGKLDDQVRQAQANLHEKLKDPEGGGILTGEVLAGLPLEGMDLAVLSACQTGLGVGADGQSAHTLQWAFQVAGCRNVVASLWKVPDEPTAALMAVFYDRLLRRKQTPLRALREAQLELFRHPERIGPLVDNRSPDFDKTVPLPADALPEGPRGRPGRGPVKAWAGFVLSGLGE
jgi:serine/threonine protein kinase